MGRWVLFLFGRIVLNQEKLWLEFSSLPPHAQKGDASEGIKLTGPDISFADETYSKLLIRYKEKFGGSPPAAFHAHAYDATGMLLSAIEAVAKVDSDGTMFIGRQAIRDVLYADVSYHGITGDLVCNENGDCANQKIVVNEIKNGNFVSVK